ncbi:prolyl oligopeptidase family serine peptidase [Flavobacteriaceae bacterium R38]|nr:prolyl oligopeptidase family serine peptidase [Flavobacteriaceae bacterium R38]
MKKKAGVGILLLLCNLSSMGQVKPEEKGFEAYQIELSNDTIDFFINKPKSTPYADLFIHIEGSYPAPIWIETDPCCATYDIFDRNLIPSNYAYVIIAKHTYNFSGKNKEVSENFWKKQTLDFRVNRVNEVINYVKKNIFKPRKIVAVGTSQGCDVVAKLGTINKDITHIGFWGSGGINQLTDFLIKVRKEVYQGKISEDQSVVIIDSLLNQFESFYNDPTPNKFWDSNSYLSYASFSEPPLESLLKIDIPIFVAIGTADQNVPVESAYAIPVEFMRNHKTNLTFRHYPNLDHSFIEKKSNGEEIDHTDKISVEFFNWVDEN